MANPEDNTIVVRVELRISFPGGKVEVSGPTVEHPGKMPSTPLDAGTIEVDVPGSVAQVRVDQATGQRFICAYGKALAGTITPPCIAAKVYSGIATAPPSPPPDDPTVRVGLVESSTGYWEFSSHRGNELPCPNCGADASGPANNTLILWASFPAGITSQPQVVPFYGHCNTQGDCPGGSGPGFALTATRSASAAPAVETVPRQWQVRASGFSNPSHAAFNGSWLLGLRPGQVAWDNGGDGQHTPLVELSGGAPAEPIWRLHFRIGSTATSYAIPAGQFNPRGSNVFHREPAGVPCPKSPPSLVVAPV